MNAPANAIIEHPDFTEENRRTVFTPQFKSRFLESLSEFGNVRLACKRGCVSRQTAYRERRRQPGFARMWDAALLAARTHAEGELADRALRGVEEPVFYHGEEVGRRRRYSDRLLLAHLGRLDRIAEREDMAGALAMLDDTIDALARGEENLGKNWEEVGAEKCAGENDGLDCVPCVPLDGHGHGHGHGHGQGHGHGHGHGHGEAVPPCATCGGPCDNRLAELAPEHCMWLGNRLDRMDMARPAGAKRPGELAKGVDAADAISAVQLDAFECGLDRWWTVESAADLDALTEARLEGAAVGAGGGSGGAQDV
ncbi:hypothetical protein GCM10023115_14460 [Pontixanthobacter gangjinensis]|uniref:Terminase small subunit n=1 Tax=Pontixanthobacter gangjinensis TaxID=1028742 RepID=A0A6I4SLC2_9SPHN|nr:hypothetical protein [Pontixanthobacter gangjinensis]MXO56691.1 hypothetical protein [Pontixanthobacter gangjinensis]